MAIYSSIINLVLRIFSILIYLVTLVAAYGGCVNPELMAFPSMITLILPYAAILTTVLTVVWLCRRKIIMAALGIITLVVCASPINTVIPLSFNKTPHTGETTFKLLTYNILHTNDLQNPDFSPSRACSYLIASGADIICLQEFGDTSEDQKLITEAQRDSLFAIYPYRIFGGRSQLSVLSRYPVKLSARESDIPLAYAVYHLDIKGNKLSIINVHLASYALTGKERDVLSGIRSVESARESVSEFKSGIRSKLGDAFRLRAIHAEKIRSLLDSIPGNAIVCGDFNDVPASWAYRTIVGEDMQDAFRNTSFGPMITYNAHAFWFNIDHVLYRGALRALSCQRGSIRTSDHYPVMVDFAFDRTPYPD